MTWILQECLLERRYGVHCQMNKKWHDPDIPQLPPLPEGERGPPLWTPDMKGTAEGNLMEWVLAMQLIHLQQKEIDGRIDWGIMKHVSEVNLEDNR